MGDRVAVVGDGKLGLLVAQVLVLEGHTVRHFGKHEHKLRLVSGAQHELVMDNTAERHAAVKQQTPFSASSLFAVTGCRAGLRPAVGHCRPE